MAHVFRAPATNLGDPDEALGPAFGPGSALVVVAIWGADKQTDLSLSVTLSLKPISKYLSKTKTYVEIMAQMD